MDEGDLESHGCSATGDQGFLNKTKSWLPAFMDRNVRTAERDKNETCIVFWSVGNEIGTGPNAQKCAEYLRGRKDKKPVQYHAPNKEDQDILCVGYPNIYRLDQFYENSKEYNKPLCLIEYAHAMGNSPGNLENLWNYVIEHPQFMGGFVWEFRSHGMERVNSDGSIDYLYGGDFHDTNHWGNFTLDGYCRSDGTPKPTFLELKYVYAPIRLAYENGVLTIHNIQSFRTTEGMDLVVLTECDGQKTYEKVIPMPVVAPGEKAQITLDPKYDGHDCFINLSVIDKGDKVAFKQFNLPSTKEKAPFAPDDFNADVIVNGDKIKVKGDNFEIDFANGLPVYYNKNGKIYFNEPMKIVTYRAETDNDGIYGVFPRWIGRWEEKRLHKMRLFTFKTETDKTDKSFNITAIGLLTYDCSYTGFNVTLNYKVYGDGLITSDMVVKPFGEMPGIVYNTKANIDPPTPRLPRFGVCFSLDKGFNSVKWFGRGEDQNYDDTVGAAPVGVYELPIEKLNFNFDVPQETGNRGDTRYAIVKNGDTGFTVYGNESFQFSLHPWKLDNLRNARHLSELKEDTEHNYLYVDYKMRALGSHSCGPNPEKYLDFEPHDFEFVFAFNGENSDSPEYFLKDFGPKTQKLSDVYVYTPLKAEREAVECEEEK